MKTYTVLFKPHLQRIFFTERWKSKSVKRRRRIFPIQYIVDENNRYAIKNYRFHSIIYIISLPETNL